MFIVLIQELIMIYIFLQQIWQYFRKECGILVSKSIIIFHQPLNNYHDISKFKTALQRFLFTNSFLHIGGLL